jgi:hypothetical protein
MPWAWLALSGCGRLGYAEVFPDASSDPGLDASIEPSDAWASDAWASDVWASDAWAADVFSEDVRSVDAPLVVSPSDAAVSFELPDVPTVLGTCIAAADCSEGEVCNGAGCGTPGFCVPRPVFCPALVDPVCGCDGARYGSSCEALRAGVRVALAGLCGCSWDLPFGAPEVIESGSTSLTSPRLSPDGLTLLYLAEGWVVISRPSLGAPFDPGSRRIAPPDALPPTVVHDFFFRRDGLERFVSLDSPADLFFQTRPSLRESWSAPAPIEAAERVNTMGSDEWNPFLTADGLTLWFQRQRGVEAHIFRTRRPGVDRSFGPVEEVDVSAAGPTPASPSLPDDGSHLVFASGGVIWVAPLDASGSPGAPRDLLPDRGGGPAWQPWIRPDGCEIFWGEVLGAGYLLLHAQR